MMSHKSIADIFNKRFPKSTVIRIIDYNEEYYVVEASEDPNSADTSSSLYGLHKKTGKVTSFSPSVDLDYFFDAVENRTLWCSY